jgi:hypothetical protein
LKTSVIKKFPPEKIMEKPDFDNFNSILNNFDDFCDAFESRAAEAFLRGDQNDGKLNRTLTETRSETPRAVREIAEPGPAPIEIGETFIDVPPSECE